MKSENLIEIRNLNKYYGKKHVLKDLNFNIKKGDRIGIIGGNGSGKTTTMEIIAKVRKATSGTIDYDKNIKAGIQFQESEYPIGITCKALINFYIGRYDKAITKEKLHSMLKVFRMEKLIKKQIVNLSGGEKQRLNILLSLIHEPNFIILDELSTGLDIKVADELRMYIEDYLKSKPKTSLILVSHSMNEIEQFANRILVLDWGKITYDVLAKNVIKKYGSIDKFARSVFEKMYKKERLQK